MGTSELLFGGEEIEEHDLRIASIAQPTDVDERRYHLGLANIDNEMRPIIPGELVIVGAREGQGKTSVAERMALSNSVDHRVLMASLEMPSPLIQDRCLAKIMGIGLSGVAWERSQKSDDFNKAMDELRLRDLLIWHPRLRKDQTVQAITKRAEDVTAAILIVDYTRLISGWRPGTEAQEIVNYFAAWVQSTKITTFLLTQLKDDAVGRRPNNSHIQDTTQLAQRADRVILLYRPYLGRPASDTIGEFIVTKNRRGPAFRGHAHWIGSPMDYSEMDAIAEQHVPCCRRRPK